MSLQFRDNDELKSYYERRYREGGYESGRVTRGVNISAIYHQERHRTALRLVAPEPSDMILDAGCGTGALAAELAPLCTAIAAIDIAANAFSPQFATIPNLRFMAMNIECLDFPASSFDRIVSVETLEHVLDPMAALRQFFRVLKPGGRLVLTYPTINRTLMQRIKLARPITSGAFIAEHLTEWRYDQLAAHLGSVGFRIEKAEGIVFDFGCFAWPALIARKLTLARISLALKIRSFPTNSLFVAVVCSKPLSR